MLKIVELAEFDEIELGFGDALGSHLQADFYGCASLPNLASELEQIMVDAAQKSRATIVASSFHEFSPQGLSGVVVIAESHLAAHTWPERNVACIDLFTCSPDMLPLPGLKWLFESFGAEWMEMRQNERGVHVSDRLVEKGARHDRVI